MTDPYTTHHQAAFEVNPETPKRPRTWAKIIAAGAIPLLALSVVVGLFIVPAPYVVTTPGPTFDLKEDIQELEVIHIEGKDPATGKPVELDTEKGGDLRMVTISEYGGPGHYLSFFDVFWLTRDGVSSVENYSDIYPDDITADQLQSFASAQMTSSHSTASVAALEELGWTVPATVTVNEVAEGVDAHGKILPGDILVAVQTPDGTVHSIDKAATIFAVTAATAPGTELVVTVNRDGKNIPIKAKTHESPDGIGSKLGIFLHVETQMPLKITFNLEDVGGPSAGMMFALTIIDRMTPGDMTGGQRIAGTGALSYDGRVQPIGGLPQKMVGARNAGAQYFLAPAANCNEITETPEGIEVFRVNTLDEARQAVESIAAGTTSSLPACLSH